MIYLHEISRTSVNSNLDHEWKLTGLQVYIIYFVSLTDNPFYYTDAFDHLLGNG
jgi:hypothetical protein